MMEKNNAGPAYKSPSYSQLGTIADPSLSMLRDQIKKVMIPMLIKIFQLKLELSQAISLPSRLQPKAKESPEEITSQLKNLDEDLKLLILWCENSRHQISKALSASEEEHKSASKATTGSPAHPFVSKSFSEALSAQPPLFKSKEEIPSEETSSSSQPETKKTWWQRFFS